MLTFLAIGTSVCLPTMIATSASLFLHPLFSSSTSALLISKSLILKKSLFINGLSITWTISSLLLMTFWAYSFLNSTTFLWTSSSWSPMNCAANIAALSPLSIPTVAIGEGYGIWIIESNASKPSVLTSTGTPITGLGVYAAIEPGKCAARPAIPMNTSIPASVPFWTISRTKFGVLCADAIFKLYGISSLSNMSIAFSAIAISDPLPRTIIIFGVI